MSKDAKNSENLLRDAIRAASDKPSTARKAERPGAVAPSPSDPNVLSDALRDQWGDRAPAGASSSSSPSSSPSTGGGAKDLIREANRGADRPVSTNTDSKTSPQPTASLGDVVRDAYNTRHSADPSAGSAASTTMRRLSLVAVAVLLAAGAALWWSTARLSGPAGVLRDLAQAVEQHRSSHNGAAPKELATLQAFPKNAVEWPLRYWNARDAAGRTEIIWVPGNSGHYRIVVRQGAEVWTVSDREGKPKLAMKGNP